MKPPLRPFHARSHRGFTMLEMLVAIAVTFTLTVFLHQVFSSMSSAVSVGLATSDVIHVNLAFNTQADDDAQRLTPPLGGGFLVILQKRIPNVQLREGDPYRADFRSDQALWVRARGSLMPLCAAGPTSYDPPQTSTQHVLVWYGHALRTNPDGTAAAALGDPGENLYASRWVLGRQARFLDPDPTAAHIDASAGYPHWRVVGQPARPADPWHKGLSDIHAQSLDEILFDFNFSSGYPTGPYRFSYGRSRLWCNPQPLGADYEPWRLSQTHGCFMPHVSDFRVDFAGDYDDALPGIDVLPSGQTAWYSHFFNNPNESGPAYQPNQPLTFRPRTTLGGLLPPGVPLASGIYDTAPPNMPHADAAFTFTPLGIEWPEMIRFRYRVHDPAGRLTETDGTPGKLFERILKMR